jgi:hypothetical protein
MGLSNIFNDIEFKGNKATTILKWVVGVAGTAVIGAFTIGSVKTNLYNKMDTVIANQTALETKVETGFNNLNAKLDAMYDAGLQGFEEYRIFNNEQLELIIEFGQSNEKANQELLTRMLKMNSREKAQQIENQIEQSRRKTYKGEVEFVPIPDEYDRLPSQAVVTEVATGLSTYYVNGAPENFLDSLNLQKYRITDKQKSERYEGLYNFTYVDKEKQSEEF